MSREEYMDAIMELMRTSNEPEMLESILDYFGASEDDSDPNEGYFVTMSNDDLRRAYDVMIDRLLEQSDPKVQYTALINSNRRLTEYEQGWVDGYEAAMTL